MAYVKQNFENGQVLKDDHLNHIEDGIYDAHDFLFGTPEAGDPYFLPTVDGSEEPEEPEVTQPSIVLSNRNASFTESTTLIIQVRLGAQPTGNVILTLSPTNSSVKVDKPLMTFTQNNWNSIQYLTLSYEGSNLTQNLSATVNISASGGGYDSISDAINVTVVNESDEPEVDPELIISNKSVQFNESENQTIQIRLGSKPTANVTVTFTANNGVSVNYQSMTFTVDNWANNQNLVISYTGSDIESNLQTTVGVSASGGGYDSLSDTINVTVIAEVTEPEPEPDPTTPDNLTMRDAVDGDFAASEFIDNIHIDESGIVTSQNPSKTYPALMVSSGGNTSAIEWTSANGMGLWILGGKDSGTGYIGFGDLSMGSLSYWATFTDGNCTPTSGVNAITNESITLSQGQRFHLNRIGTVVSLYLNYSGTWNLVFKIDLATCGHFEPSQYVVNALGVLVGGSYQTIKDVKVYGG